MGSITKILLGTGGILIGVALLVFLLTTFAGLATMSGSSVGLTSAVATINDFFPIIAILAVVGLLIGALGYVSGRGG